MMNNEKVNYYLDIAHSVSKKSTCLRAKYGAVIVKDDEIISTGYNGAPRGRRHCTDLGYCRRKMLEVPRGERYELCRSVHSEQNAIISASRRDMIGSSLFLVGTNPEDGSFIENVDCCSICKKLIINAGIDRVFIRTSETEYQINIVNDWVINDETLGEHRGY